MSVSQTASLGALFHDAGDTRFGNCEDYYIHFQLSLVWLEPWSSVYATL